MEIGGGTEPVMRAPDFEDQQPCAAVGHGHSDRRLLSQSWEALISASGHLAAPIRSAKTPIKLLPFAPELLTSRA
jgi:hypothetical protein